MTPTSPSTDRNAVAATVKRIVIAESRLSLRPERIADDEPLNGKLLKVNSLGFVGMLILLEDELGVTLPDDIFVARSFHTVADLIDVVATASAAER